MLAGPNALALDAGAVTTATASADAKASSQAAQAVLYVCDQLHNRLVVLSAADGKLIVSHTQGQGQGQGTDSVCGM